MGRTLTGYRAWLSPAVRERIRQEVAAEIAWHIQDRAEDLCRGGMSREAAEREALRVFGDPEAIAHECLLAAEHLPGRRITQAVVASLLLTAGILAFLFSILAVRGVLHGPLRFQAPDQLVALRQAGPRVSTADFLHWRDQAQSFSSMTLYDAYEMTRTGAGAAHRVKAMLIDSSFFDVIGASPTTGRMPVGAGSGIVSPATREVLLSTAYWKLSLAADPGVLGRDLILDGDSYAVVGIMPESAQLTHKVDVWIPLPGAATPDRSLTQASASGYVLGRLKPSVRLDEAESELARMESTDQMESPGSGHRARIFPLAELYRNEVRRPLARSLSISLLLLLMAILVTAQWRRGMHRRAGQSAGRAPFSVVTLHGTIPITATGISFSR